MKLFTIGGAAASCWVMGGRPEQQFHGAQHADRRVHVAVDELALDVRADDQPAVRWESTWSGPFWASSSMMKIANALQTLLFVMASTILPDGDVVRGDLRLRRVGARRGAAGVILAERHEHEVGHRAVAVHLLELFDEAIRALVVAGALAPADRRAAARNACCEPRRRRGGCPCRRSSRSGPSAARAPRCRAWTARAMPPPVLTLPWRE